MLSPYTKCSEKYWSQVTKLKFHPAPWALEWCHTESILDKNYTLVYSHNGPMHGCVTLKSEPFTLKCSGSPFFKPELKEVRCHLYRVFTLSKNVSNYKERIFVLSENGHPISFSPYFKSKLNFHPSVIRNFARSENIPDYFAVWRHFGSPFYGYGVASNCHIENLRLNEDQFEWRLKTDFQQKTINVFMYFDNFSDFDKKINFYHSIGHYGWYEQIYKPLRSIPKKSWKIDKLYTY
jgi:hypothetical protein